MKKIIVFIGVFALVAGFSQARAMATDVQVYPGSVNVNVGGVKVDTSAGGVKVNTGTAKVNVQQGSAQKPATSAQVKTVKTSATSTVKVNIATSTQRSVMIVKTNDDLDFYNKTIIKNHQNIESVDVSSSSVKVAYKQPARFLGIFKTDLNAVASVDSNGAVVVSLPWYSFFYTKNTADVKTAMQAGLSVTGGSSKVDVSNLISGNQEVRVQNVANVVDVMTSAIDSKVSVSVQN